MRKPDPALEKIRLQKFLSQNGVCSRRKAEELIQAGVVFVNGIQASVGQKVIQGSDKITVDGSPVKVKTISRHILIMNKPKGVVCSNHDPHNYQTVFDLLHKNYLREKLFCAGRLDKDSEGLIVITNDGDFANKLTHPSSNIVKRYRVTLTRPFDSKHIKVLLKGVKYENELLKADKIIPATKGMDKEKRLEIHLHQGRKREIRRMLEFLGYRVRRLRRFQIGKLVLKNLPTGKSRALSDHEIKLLLS